VCTKLEIYVFIFEKQIMAQENTAPKTKNRAIQTPVKQGDELMCSPFRHCHVKPWLISVRICHNNALIDLSRENQIAIYRIYKNDVLS
jgi:hypothetical protein